MLPCQKHTGSSVLNRRDFVAALFTGLACCRSGTTAWAQSMAGGIIPETSGKLTLKLAGFPVLMEEGGSIGLMYGTDYPVLISRLAVGFVALRGECPHASGTVIPFDGSYLCTNHGSMFDAEGVAFAGPAVGAQLSRYPLVNQAGGVLEITIPNLAYRITVISLSGADRLAMTFETKLGAKYEVRFGAQASETESVVSFATTPEGTLSQTELNGNGSNRTVYVARTGQSGFFVVNVKVAQL